MILSQGPPVNSVFLYNNLVLENVDTYKYLGLIISRTGNLNRMIHDRIVKTNRAAFMLQKALSVGQNVSVKLAMTLFEKQLSPILLYGCSIWGIPDRVNYIKIKSQTPFETQNIRNEIFTLFKHVGANFKNEDLLFVRRNTTKNEISVKLTDDACKQEIMNKLNLAPVSLLIEDFQPKQTVFFERPYTNFIKFALGISKYASNTLALGEVGRFPIQLKAIRQSILYWYRLECGTTNILLNCAYRECTENDHDWIKNIREFLSRNGLESLRQNVHLFHRNYVKYRVKNNLESQYISQYNTYTHPENKDTYEKCAIIRTCRMDLQYKQATYLEKIESPQVRSIFTRLRIDCNNSNDCKFRSYRFKHQDTDKCTFCPNKVDSVAHVILHCQHPDVMKVRNSFYNTYSIYHSNFMNLDDNDKLYHMLNVTTGENIATHALCSFIKRIYSRSRCIIGGSANL